jgi:hypothetical protein
MACPQSYINPQTFVSESILFNHSTGSSVRLDPFYLVYFSTSGRLRKQERNPFQLIACLVE